MDNGFKPSHTFLNFLFLQCNSLCKNFDHVSKRGQLHQTSLFPFKLCSYDILTWLLRNHASFTYIRVTTFARRLTGPVIRVLLSLFEKEKMEVEVS